MCLRIVFDVGGGTFDMTPDRHRHPSAWVTHFVDEFKRKNKGKDLTQRALRRLHSQAHLASVSGPSRGQHLSGFARLLACLPECPEADNTHIPHAPFSGELPPSTNKEEEEEERTTREARILATFHLRGALNDIDGPLGEDEDED